MTWCTLALFAITVAPDASAAQSSEMPAEPPAAETARPTPPTLPADRTDPTGVVESATPSATDDADTEASEVGPSSPEPRPRPDHEGLFDPWVPLPPRVRAAAPHAAHSLDVPLVDPWKTGPGFASSNPRDPDLRHPFRGQRPPTSAAPHRTDLRDPFASAAGIAGPARSAGERIDLRDPFARPMHRSLPSSSDHPRAVSPHLAPIQRPAAQRPATVSPFGASPASPSASDPSPAPRSPAVEPSQEPTEPGTQVPPPAPSDPASVAPRSPSAVYDPRSASVPA